MTYVLPDYDLIAKTKRWNFAMFCLRTGCRNPIPTPAYHKRLYQMRNRIFRCLEY